MAAAGLRPCHLNSRSSNASQASQGSCPTQFYGSKTPTGKHHAQSLLECPNSASGADDRRIALSQQKLNLICMIQFATSLMAALNGINKQSFQVFKLKIGVNTGSVIAGIIGAQRPFYDIWGDCVNVSLPQPSYTYSSGTFVNLKVSEESNSSTFSSLQTHRLQVGWKAWVRLDGYKLRRRLPSCSWTVCVWKVSSHV